MTKSRSSLHVIEAGMPIIHSISLLGELEFKLVNDDDVAGFSIAESSNGVRLLKKIKNYFIINQETHDNLLPVFINMKKTFD